MPRELVAIAPREAILREYRETKLGPKQVRVRSEFSSPKHGTELANYRGRSPFNLNRYDHELGLFFPEENPLSGFPMSVGNISVGTVIEVGISVGSFKVGDRVFGYLPIRQTHTVSEESLHRVPDGMSPEAIVCWDPARFALGAVRDAGIRLGDRAAVFGMGAIGLLTIQMARLSGATTVIAVEPVYIRRLRSFRLGSDHAMDPANCDVAREIRHLTDKNGVDVAIEASGSYEALHQAIRSVHFGGLVVPLAFYSGEAKGLRLGEEWHMNRISMRSSRSASDPNRDHPMWDHERIQWTAFDLLRFGRVSVDGVIFPVVPFEESAEAYRRIDISPQESVKLGVTYPGE